MSFPVSPSNNQVTTVNGIVYQYRSDKTAWIIVPSTAIGSAADTANAAFDKANSANVLAQAAFNTANTALFKSGFDNGVTANVVIISNTTASISNTTGALRVVGGVGISGNLYVAGNIVDTTGNTVLKQDTAGNVIISGTLTVQNTNILLQLQNAFNKANAANVLAQAAYDQANSASGNTIVLAAGNVAQNSNITFLTGFSQGAYDKANSANTFAQSAYDNSNTKFNSSGGNISGDVTIINNKNLVVTGNLTVQGNLVTTNTQSFTVADPLIVLGTGNYTTDVKDIGFAGHYNDGVNAHSGLVRDSTTKEWYLFKGYTPELDANNNLDIADASFRTANLNADIVRGNLIGTTATVNNIELGGFTSAAYYAANVVAAGLVSANANISFLTGFSQGAYDKANTTATVANSTAVVANIVAAGLVSANANISFLTGFSQGAYDKANTTATVANSTAVVANIVAAGLVATNTNTAIALAGVAAANSNISFLTGFSQGAYDKANAANVLAQAAFDAANSAAAGTADTYARGLAQGAYNKANAAYDFANTIAGSSSFGGGTVANATYFANNTISTNTNTGALRVAGGFGVGGDVFIAGNLTVGGANVINSLNFANNNITFLTGFSQGAYNLANVVQAGLVATNTNTTIALAGVAAANANINVLYAVDVSQNANIAIALAGVVAANSNISFLTGFAQAAYDKVNTTATVANSTAVVANIVAAGLVATNTNTAIALAGVAAANANISFLTGFSQGAYDKANTTATVANSTAVVANIVAAGLVATNTNVTIALAGVAAANSNISFLTGFSQAAFDKANIGAISANSSLQISGHTPNVVIFANSGGYLSNTTGFQFYSTNNTGRLAGTLYVGGETGKSALIANGYNQRGGVGYQGFLEVTNEYGSATNPSKFFRLDPAGSFQIRNSSDSQTIFQLTDGGEVTIPLSLKANSIQFVDGSIQWTANAGGSSALAQGAYDKANSANVLAQAAYNQANIGGSGITITTAATPPVSGNTNGSQWYNTTNDTLYEWTTSDGVYYYWIDIQSPSVASSNAITVTGVSTSKSIAFALIFGG